MSTQTVARFRERPDVIVDRPDAVLAFLQHLHARGELVRYEPARPVINHPDKVAVRYVCRELAPRAVVAARPTPARWSVRRQVIGAAVVVGVPTGLILLAVWWAWTHVLAILGLLVAVLIVLALLSRTRGGRAVIGLFENGRVRWFDERR